MVNKKKVNCVVDKAWEIYPIPLLMTDMEVRVQFYTMEKPEHPKRHVANGLKNRLNGRYTVMLAKGERKRLMAQYDMSVNELYRYLDHELRRVVEMMEQNPELYMQSMIVD